LGQYIRYNTFMQVIVGLGNPGEKYAHTRHNVGFILVDKLAAAHGVTWKDHPKWEAEVAATNDHIFVKPQTFMNESGRAVKAVLNYYKLDPIKDLIVIHDEMDFPVGEVHKHSGKSSANHNGVQDIIEVLGTQDFTRIRVGIDRPDNPKMLWSDYVLERLPSADLDKINSIDIESYL
jgi:PTH1 family peptidyl-tRNA hydrolase